MIEDVAKMTGGRVRLRAGTLYAALLVPPATFAFGLVMLERRETAAPPG